MSDQASSLLEASAYQWRPDPFPLRRAELTDDEIAMLKALEAKLAPAVEKPKVPAPVTDPEVLKLREEVRQLRAATLKRLKDAETKAAEVIKWAEDNADAKLKEAGQQGYQEGLSLGSAEGYEQGKRKGEEDGLRQFAELNARWQSVLSATMQEKANYLADRETLMIQIAIEMAAKIVGYEVNVNHELALQQVRSAIKRVTERSRLVIHLNPEDIEKAKSVDEASFKMIDGIKQIEFVADDKVMAGGAYVETDSGSIDARLETQLAELSKSLIETARHAQ